MVIKLWICKDKVREEEVVVYVVFAMAILALLLRLEYWGKSKSSSSINSNE